MSYNPTREDQTLPGSHKKRMLSKFFFFTLFGAFYKTLCDLTARMLALLLDSVVCPDGCDHFDVHP